MAKKTFLDSIQSPFPCSKNWDEMIGGDQVRFCQSCEKNVYNLSAMPRKEARKFVAQNAGKICVRYNRLPNGKVQTADTKLYKITGRRASRLAAGVLGASLTLSTMTNGQTPPKTENQKATTKLQTKNLLKTSRISFTLLDENGAVVSYADVELTNQKTKKKITVSTNDEGVVLFNLLPLGKYVVVVPEYNGFAKYQKTIELKARVESNIEIVLKPKFFEVIGDFIIN